MAVGLDSIKLSQNAAAANTNNVC